MEIEIAKMTPHKDLFANFTPKKREEAIRAFCGHYGISLEDMQADELLAKAVRNQVEMNYLNELEERIGNAHLIYMLDMLRSGAWMALGAIHSLKEWTFVDYIETYMGSKRNHAIDVGNMIERVLLWIDRPDYPIFLEDTHINTAELIVRGIPLYKMLKVSREFSKLHFADENNYIGLDKDAERKRLVLLLANNANLSELEWVGNYRFKAQNDDDEHQEEIVVHGRLSLPAPSIRRLKNGRRLVTMTLENDEQYFIWRAALEPHTNFNTTD